MIALILGILLSSAVAWAEPVAPTAPIAVPTTVAPALCTVSVANLNDMRSYLTGSSVGGSSVTGCGAHTGPWFGDQVELAVASYDLQAIAGTLALPAAGGTSAGSAVGATAVSGSSGAGAVSGSSGASASAATGGDNYVTLISANHASLPATGTRIAQADSANMPIIVAPTAAQGILGAFTVADNAHHYRIVGVKAIGSSVSNSISMFNFQSPSRITDYTTHPHHMILDRVLCTGDATYGANQCLMAEGANIAVLDSRITNIIEQAGGSACSGECHGILFDSGTGPYFVKNTEVSADGVPVFIGDSKVSIWTGGSYGVGSPVIPSDITIDQAWLHRPVSWNQSSRVYSTGTAAVNGAGTTITLTGATADSAWADGTYYFCLADSTYSSYPCLNSPGANAVRPISAVNVGASTLTLSSAYPDHTSTSGNVYKVTKWAGLTGKNDQKNLIEAKQAKRVLLKNSVLEMNPHGSQSHCIFLAAVHGNGASSSDINITNNYIKNCWGVFYLTGRPSQATGTSLALTSITGDGTTNCSGGPCINLDLGAPVNSTTNDTIEITGTPVTEANGQWPMTLVGTPGTTHIVSIPVRLVSAEAFPIAPATTVVGSVVIWNAGSPTVRVAVTNNVIEDPGYGATGLGDGNVSMMNISVTPTLSPTGGPGDTSLSDLGHWRPDDWNISHNTIVGPTTPDTQAALVRGINPGAATYASYWKGNNFTWRDNVMKLSTPTEGNTKGFAVQNPAFAWVMGSAGLDLITDSATRDFRYNAFFYPWSAGVANELVSYTGSDTNVAVMADQTTVGFTSYTAGTVTNYALTNLYTTGTCTTNATTTVTCSTSIPATVVKGTPFKINSVGTFRLVESVSGTTITLQSAYPTSNTTAAFTLGFKGWSSDGTDPGADVSALATAISGVGQ